MPGHTESPGLAEIVADGTSMGVTVIVRDVDVESDIRQSASLLSNTVIVSLFAGR